MSIRLYTSLDAGAPQPTQTRLIERIQTILMACLVNGYGSGPGAKAPAGWSVGHIHADGFSLGSGEGFVNYVHYSATEVRIYIMETLTAGDAALATGYNRRSGPWFDGAVTSARQHLYLYGPMGVNANQHWSVLADDKTVIFFYSGGQTTSDASNPGGGVHYFGRYHTPIGPGFCSMGCSTGSTPIFIQGGAGMALRNPFTGLVDQGIDPYYYGAAGFYHSSKVAETAANRPYVLPQFLSFHRTGALVFGNSVVGGTSLSRACFAGYMRGLVVEPNLVAVQQSQVMALLGLPNTWQQRVMPIHLANGKQVVPYFTGYDGALFGSLNPADWE